MAISRFQYGKFVSEDGESIVDAFGCPLATRYDGYSVLRSKVKQVDAINHSEFSRLTAPIKRFVAVDENPQHLDEVICRELELRVGARVMLLRNISVREGLVNGTIGTVKGFLRIDEGAARQLDQTSIAQIKNISEECLFPVVEFPLRRFNGDVGAYDTATVRLIVEV